MTATQQLAVGANGVIACAYLAICGWIVAGLLRTGQLRTNRLGLATAAIFLASGTGRGLYLTAMLADGAPVFPWWTAAWDVLTALVAATYLGLRGSYGVLLRTPVMYDDEVREAAGRRVRAVFDRLAEGAAMIDADGRILEVNLKGREIMRGLKIPFTFEHTVGEMDWRAIRPNGAALPDGEFPAEVTRRTGRAQDHVELGFPDVDGGTRWIAISTRPLDDDGVLPCAVTASFTDVTEARRMREALLRSERRHRAVVDTLHEGVVLLDASGRMLAANSQAAQILEVTQEHLVGQPAIAPDWWCVRADGSPLPYEEHPVVVALRTGEPQVGEVVGVELLSGARRWISLNVKPVDSGDGLAAALSFVDVTARVESDRARDVAEQRLRATVDSLAEGVIFCEPDGRVSGVNATARTMLGLGSDGPMTLPWVLGGRVGVWPNGRIARTVETIDRARLHGVSTDRARLGLRDVAGTTQWFELSARPIRAGDEPGPHPVVLSFTDITARLARENVLAEAEERFRTTFQSAPIGMGLVATDGRILRANRALSEIVGYTPEQLEELSSRDITHPEDLAGDEAELARAVSGETDGYRLEKRYIHAMGHFVWVQLDVSIVRGGDGGAQYAVAQIQDITERRDHDEQLEHLADHDALTGLLNRRGFQAALESHVAHGARYGVEGAVLMFDLDHFKYVNDTLGHKAGDEVIMAAADLLSTRLRGTDVVARLGGDEFAVLIPHGSEIEARRVAVSLLEGFRRRAAAGSGAAARLTASVGIALCTPGLGADELLVNADLAMYDAKEEGRDRWAIYADGDDSQPRMKARLSWLERVRDAIDEGAFDLHAQPIVDLRNDVPPMHELLLRMRSPGGELIPPASFLPIAERVDLIQQIDRMVVLRAIDALAAADSPLTLTVNVSGKSFGDLELLHDIEEALSRTSVEPEHLVLEITETAAVAQIAQARAFAQGLHELGCRLAIDDFGAGFGSFTYLKHLPFDYLKIDGEFVSAALRSRPDALIVQAVRHMAHGMGREVIAEHCTDDDLVRFLKTESVDYAQGFHLGRPQPIEQVVGAVA